MRPETLRNKLGNAIKHWLSTGDNLRIKALIKPMKKQWAVWAKEDCDYRSGAETYGYHDRESVASNMMYISDRWRCTFRLKWIIDGVENGSI